MSGEYDLPGGFVLSANGGYSYNNWQLITDVINQYPSPLAIWAYVPERLESTSGEIRLSSPQDSPFKYRVGFNYASDNLSFDTNIDINSTLVLNVAPPEDIDSHTYGIFGGASYDFTSKLTFDVELRAQIDQLNERLVTTGEAESASFLLVHRHGSVFATSSSAASKATSPMRRAHVRDSSTSTSTVFPPPTRRRCEPRVAPPLRCRRST